MNTSRRPWLPGLFLAVSLAASVGAADDFRSAFISEFLADNQRGLRDEDGDHPGWIEICNGGKAMVNLSGWFLTDDPANLTKWRFPAVGLLPDKYLVVFASAKHRTNGPVHWHANFQLAKKGGYLALVNPATNVVSEFLPTRPSTDVSSGTVRGEPGRRGQFTQPTPGKPNASSGDGFAPEVVFSKPGGNFTTPFSVELKGRRSGFRTQVSEIRYTLDGTFPTTNSPLYAAPLLITTSVQLRARCYQASRLPGPPHSEAYLKLSTNVLGFTSDLPVLIMDAGGRDVPVSAHGSFVQLTLHEPVKGRTSLTNAPTLTTRGGYRIRGSSSSGMPQSSFALHFLDEFNEEKPLSLLGLPAESDWILYAPNSYDPAMIHNPFIHQLSRDLGRYSPRTRFVEVFVAGNMGGAREISYHGLYVLEEKIKIGPHRVNLDHLNTADLKPPGITGGYLLKFDRPGPGEQGFSAGWLPIIHVDPKEQTLTLPQRAAQQNYIATYFQDFNRALSGPKWRDPSVGYPAYLDVDAAIDFHVLEVLSGNVDAMVLSTYFHKPRNGKIVCGPHWDFDRALGSTDGRDANPRQWNTGPFFGGTWWPQLFSDPDFWQRWVDRWQELRQTHFSLTNLNGLADRLHAEVREAQPREQRRWGLQPRGGSYLGEIALMKEWLSNRVDFIDQQLVPRPQPSQAGGRIGPGFQLTLSAPTNAAIYYTLDGSDPRLSQGGISSNAILYTNPISLKATGRILVRAYNVNQRQLGGPPVSTPWSGPVAMDFLVGASPRPRPADRK